jgi:hypothetical protein
MDNLHLEHQLMGFEVSFRSQPGLSVNYRCSFLEESWMGSQSSFGQVALYALVPRGKSLTT